MMKTKLKSQFVMNGSTGICNVSTKQIFILDDKKQMCHCQQQRQTYPKVLVGHCVVISKIHYMDKGPHTHYTYKTGHSKSTGVAEFMWFLNASTLAIIQLTVDRGISTRKAMSN